MKRCRGRSHSEIVRWLEGAIAAYLARGGVITRYPPGHSGLVRGIFNPFPGLLDDPPGFADRGK